MPTRNSPDGQCLLDTSTAVTFVRPEQSGHAETYAALAGRQKGLAGHAVFETFSVLTRLPPPQRLGPRDARRLIETNFPHSRHLAARRSAGLLAELADSAILGGSVYDALVAACAREHGLPLVTRDRRAAGTYRAIGAEVELLQ